MITAMPRIAIAVNDFDGIVATFRKIFGMPVIDMSEDSVPGLGAKLAMCVPPGGSNIELMCPANPGAPLSQSLQRFLDRRGEGLFALMLEAPVPDEEAEVLLENGLGVLPLMQGAGGRDIHPKSTHGVLIRVYPERSFTGELSPSNDPLQISGIVRVVVAVADIDHAVHVYGQGMGLATDAPTVDVERGVKTATVHPRIGGTIELVSPHDSDKSFSSAIAAFLGEKGEGMYALVLQADNLAEAADVLTSRGLSVSENGGALEIDRNDTFGALICIEQGQE